MTQFLSIMLKKDGYQVTIANNGPEALQALRQEEFGCVLTDVKMPGMDGLELSRVLRDDSRFASLPLIILTSLGEHGFGARAKQSGVSAYLSKPVRQSQLFDCLYSSAHFAGRRVLADGTLGAGEHLLRWEPSESGRPSRAPGIYFVVARAGGQIRSSRIVVLR